jgi:hypothetical protein
MPDIVGIDLTDGITIKTGSGHSNIRYTKAQLETLFATKTIAQCETAANTWLAGQFSQGKLTDNIQIHIFSLSPLTYTTICSSAPIPANWWTIGAKV